MNNESNKLEYIPNSKYILRLTLEMKVSDEKTLTPWNIGFSGEEKIVHYISEYFQDNPVLKEYDCTGENCEFCKNYKNEKNSLLESHWPNGVREQFCRIESISPKNIVTIFAKDITDGDNLLAERIDFVLSRLIYKELIKQIGIEELVKGYIDISIEMGNYDTKIDLVKNMTIKVLK